MKGPKGRGMKGERGGEVEGERVDIAWPDATPLLQHQAQIGLIRPC